MKITATKQEKQFLNNFSAMNAANTINTTNVYFDTLGCAKNVCDTSKMQDDVVNAGFNVVDEPDTADVIVLNTCAFIELACQESIDTFFEYRNCYPEKKIIVAGCLPSRYGEDLTKSLSEADGFLPCSKEADLSKLILSLGFKHSNKVQNKNNEQKAFAYVKISDGCNRNCSYCMIPKIRGKYKSMSYDEISNDVKREVGDGAKEIILVAQDCGVWGRDFSPKLSLAHLLDKLSAQFESTSFRCLYIGPDGIDENLLKLIAAKDNISKYFDIPLQHCNSNILKAMHRPGSGKDYLRIINLVRKTIPNCTLRTTFMVGFPGESESQFDELCNFVQTANFDYAGCFEYSNEEGSASAELDNQVPDSVKNARANTLREILDAISLNRLEQKVGKTFAVIIEGVEDGRYFGRAEFQAPEVDGLVFISEYCDTKVLNIGDKVNVKISDTEGYDLVGSVVSGG